MDPEDKGKVLSCRKTPKVLAPPHVRKFEMRVENLRGASIPLHTVAETRHNPSLVTGN